VKHGGFVGGVVQLLLLVVVVEAFVERNGLECIRGFISRAQWEYKMCRPITIDLRSKVVGGPD
jgi:hypothetical protein